MDTTLDTLARTLAATTSRRDALRALGAFTATTALAFVGLGFTGPSSGGAPSSRGASADAGACGAPPDNGMPEFCSNSSNCLCMDTTEGERTCAELPADYTYCEAPLCTTSADCAGLGAAYVCGSPGSGFCDDDLGRCVAPCGVLDWGGTWTGTSTLGSERVDVRFDITDVDDAFSGRLFVTDPLNGVSIDLGELSGFQLSSWATLTTATGLIVMGEFLDRSFTGTIQFPQVGNQEAFWADVTLTKVDGPVGVDPDAPGDGGPRPVEILAPYPNPARAGAAVTVPIRVSVAGPVRVAVYDAIGREVAVLHDGSASAGDIRLPVATSLPAGVYVVRATSGTAAVTRTLTVVR